MQVYLIPIGAGRHEPYYEPADDADAPPVEERGWMARQRRRLAEILREAEAERHRRHESAADPAPGFGARLRRRFMRWMVERAAEQRLLWHLRTADAATLQAPDDLTPADALGIMRLGLRKDGDRHFRWFLVNLVALIASGVFFFVPGPNLIGYFFTFTTVGHLLAWRGAARGDRRVAWQVVPNGVLTDLGAALQLPSPEKERLVHAAASSLGLQHLATFVERLAVPSA